LDEYIDLSGGQLIFKKGFFIPSGNPIVLGLMRIDSDGGHIVMGGKGGCNSLLVANDGNVYTGTGGVVTVPNNDRWKSCAGSYK
jgi:hypothetical protein